MSTPGWYTDPADPNGLRWWDGERWTNAVTARPTTPAPAPAPAAPPAVDRPAPVAQAPASAHAAVAPAVAASGSWSPQPVAARAPVATAAAPLPAAVGAGTTVAAGAPAVATPFAAPSASSLPPAAPTPPHPAFAGPQPSGLGHARGVAPGRPMMPMPPAPPARKGWSTTTKVLVALASLLVAIVLLGVVAAIAIPVFLAQQQRAALAEIDCTQVAADAVALSQQDAGADLIALVSLDDMTLAEDHRPDVRTPPAGQESLVLTCAGTGVWADGFESPTSVDVYLDHQRQTVLSVRWEE